MTVATTSRKVTYEGNDVTTVWDFTFPVLDADHISVQVYDSVLAATETIDPANYAVVLNEDGTGTVTYPTSGTPLTTTDTIVIIRTVPYTQGLAISNQDGFYPNLVEDQLDLQVMMIQQLKSDVDRVITSPIFDSDLLSLELPPAADRAEKYLYFDSDGNVSVTGTAPAVQYQGAFSTASEPTTRLGGTALQEGDLYFNTTVSRLKVYTGAVWTNGVDSSTSIDIVGMTALADPLASGDLIPMYDLSSTANRKMTPQQLFNYLGALTTETTIDLANDFLALYDASGSATDKVTPQVFLNQLGAVTTLAQVDLDAAADWVTVYDQSAGAIKKIQVDDLPSGSVTLGTPVSPSGSANADFTIPAGTSIIHVGFAGISGSGTGNFGIQLGTASTPETTGYVSAADNGSTTNSTTRILMTRNIAAADVHHGNATLMHLGNDEWTVSGVLIQSTGDAHFFGGSITLGGELDILRVLISAGTFDAGVINVATQ